MREETNIKDNVDIGIPSKNHTPLLKTQKYSVCVLSEEVIDEGNKPFQDETDNMGYLRFCEIAKEKGILLYIANLKNYNQADDSIRNARTWDGEWTHKDISKVDFVYDKFPIARDIDGLKEYITKKYGRVNSLEFEDLCKDKMLSYKVFNEFMSKTFTAMSQDEFHEAIKNIPSEMVVLKPIDGHGGAGIFIGSKGECKNKWENYPGEVMIQEFVDSKEGIPELNFKGIHDLRIVVVNGVACSCFIRKPKSGLISNVSLGGEKINVPLEDIPQGAIELFHKVDKKIENHNPRIYSIDMLRQNNGNWKLIELNSKPGIFRMDMDDEIQNTFLTKLTDVILNILQK
ncbi:MAG: ATP-grasp domain-containing protein [Nanoarchaeota archaeon]|nr:ATP-grasp domain-containing protein [Nanoarchaeota archaeon]